MGSLRPGLIWGVRPWVITPLECARTERLFDAQMGPGKDTQTCVEHALRLGHVGLIKEAISRVEQVHGFA